MNKKKIHTILIIFILLVYGCGFTPQYAGFKNLDFYLKVGEIRGDRDLNNEIKSQLKKYESDREDLEQININYDSKYDKITISKNTKGEATKYNLKVDIVFQIKSENYSTKIIFNEEFKIDKIDDTIEENNYIRIVKRNFAEKAVEKVILNIRQNK